MGPKIKSGLVQTVQPPLSLSGGDLLSLICRDFRPPHHVRGSKSSELFLESSASKECHELLQPLK